MAVRDRERKKMRMGRGERSRTWRTYYMCLWVSLYMYTPAGKGGGGGPILSPPMFHNPATTHASTSIAAATTK